MNAKLKLFTVAVVALIWGCMGATDIRTPEKIGEKDRVRVITGDRAAAIVNKMHSGEVAGDDNAIAEYGSDKKAVLYITYYRDPNAAQKGFDTMIEKIRATKNSPFFHLMPLQKYQNKVYITLGMGAVHYIYVSGNFLLWMQTAQSFGDQLPRQLLKFYPVFYDAGSNKKNDFI
jgi:hypothetical protein